MLVYDVVVLAMYTAACRVHGRSVKSLEVMADVRQGVTFVTAPTLPPQAPGNEFIGEE